MFVIRLMRVNPGLLFPAGDSVSRCHGYARSYDMITVTLYVKLRACPVKTDTKHRGSRWPSLWSGSHGGVLNIMVSYWTGQLIYFQRAATKI